MSNYKPYQVPQHIAEQAEKIAEERRRQAGEDVRWSTVIREVLDRWFKNSQK